MYLLLEVYFGPKNTPLQFGGDPDYDPYPAYGLR